MPAKLHSSFMWYGIKTVTACSSFACAHAHPSSWRITSVPAGMGRDELDSQLEGEASGDESSLQVLQRQVQQQMYLLHQQQLAVAREAQVRGT